MVKSVRLAAATLALAALVAACGGGDDKSSSSATKSGGPVTITATQDAVLLGPNTAATVCRPDTIGATTACAACCALRMHAGPGHEANCYQR